MRNFNFGTIRDCALGDSRLFSLNIIPKNRAYKFHFLQFTLLYMAYALEIWSNLS